MWIAGAPNFRNNSDTEIIQYIDSVISTSLPDKTSKPVLYQLAKKLQTHHHTWTCKKGNTGCRFSFPRPITPKTHILHNVNITTKGRFYETVRTEEDVYINAYNPTLLQRWRANMDIQMVGAAQGLAYYVCSYIAKAEPDDLKDALAKA